MGNNKNNGKTIEILEWVKSILIAITVALIIMFFIRPVVVHKQSMEPTFHSGDYIFISRQSYKMYGSPELGDVVVFRTGRFDEKGNEQYYIKRVIGVPGDSVEIIEGRVFVNDKVLDEEYLSDQFSSGNMNKVNIPEGKIFVMGDNRAHSLDSRSSEVGLVDISAVMGKVVFRGYPFNKIALF